MSIALALLSRSQACVCGSDPCASIVKRVPTEVIAALTSQFCLHCPEVGLEVVSLLFRPVYLLLALTLLTSAVIGISVGSQFSLLC